MTKLDREIEDAVDKLVAEMTKLRPGYYNADCLYDLERMILKTVGPYLSLPNDNEPLPEKMTKISEQKWEGSLPNMTYYIDTLIDNQNAIIDYLSTTKS